MHNNAPIKNFFSNQREFLISFFVFLSCLILFLKLPAANPFERTCKEIFFFLLIPLFYIKLILKKDLLDFGLTLPRKKSDFFWALGIFFIFWGTFLFLIKFTDFQSNYHLSRAIKNNFNAFLFYELITFNFLFLIQEFFFKGFVLFSLRSKFKFWSILITALIYCAALFIEKSFIWQAAPLIFYAFFGTFLTYKSKSLWIAYLTGLISLISMDSFLIYISK